jgi:hypothetical protein
LKRTVPPLIEFFAPLPLAAVVLLGLNDHFWKARFHNQLTGKLSDVALCFILPLYVSAVLGLIRPWPINARLLVGSIVTAIVFVLLELSDTAGSLFSSVIIAIGAPFGVHRVVLTRDPTDLFTLALIPLAWWYGRRRALRCAPDQLHSGGGA